MVDGGQDDLIAVAAGRGDGERAAVINDLVEEALVDHDVGDAVIVDAFDVSVEPAPLDYDAPVGKYVSVSGFQVIKMVEEDERQEGGQEDEQADQRESDPEAGEERAGNRGSGAGVKNRQEAFLSCQVSEAVQQEDDEG